MVTNFTQQSAGHAQPHSVDLGSVESARGRLQFKLCSQPEGAWAVLITGIDPGDLRKAGISLWLPEGEYGALKALMAKTDAAIAALQDTRAQNHQKLMAQLHTLAPEALQQMGIDPTWLQ